MFFSINYVDMNKEPQCGTEISLDKMEISGRMVANQISCCII